MSLSEALALAVIPQQPGRRARFGPSLQNARLRLMADWRETYPQDPRNDSLLDLPLEARNRQEIPFWRRASSEQLLAAQAGNELNSTLNLPLQQLLERLITGFIAERRSTGVENATAILIDSRDQASRRWWAQRTTYPQTSMDRSMVCCHGARPGVLAQTVSLWAGAGPRGDPPMSILKDLPVTSATSNRKT